jgi:esterase
MVLLHSLKLGAQGPPLLFVHGWLGKGSNFYRVATNPVLAPFSKHLLDLRNHGRSPKGLRMSLGDMADDIC